MDCSLPLLLRHWSSRVSCKDSHGSWEKTFPSKVWPLSSPVQRKTLKYPMSLGMPTRITPLERNATIKNNNNIVYQNTQRKGASLDMNLRHIPFVASCLSKLQLEQSIAARTTLIKGIWSTRLLQKKGWGISKPVHIFSLTIACLHFLREFWLPFQKS